MGTYYTCDQPYYDKTKDPKWATRPAYTGWLPWTPGTGGGVTEYFMNKVWDPYGSGQWVPWETVGAPDPTGVFYPDPYGSGYGACSNHRVTGKRYA